MLAPHVTTRLRRSRSGATWSGLLLRLALLAPLLATGVWTWLRLLGGLPGPLRIVWLGCLLIGLLGVGLSRWPRTAACGLGLLLLAGIALLHGATEEREWLSIYERTPIVEFDGELVHLGNLRHASTDVDEVADAEVRWYDATFDLTTVAGVDLVIEPMSQWYAVAHVFLTFGFDDGRHLVISVGARMFQDEPSVLTELLSRPHELIYAMGDERDFIGRPATSRGASICLYPLALDRDQVRALLIGMLVRAQGLSERPETFDLLTNNCTLNVADHLEQVTGVDFAFDPRLLLSTHIDALLVDVGLLQIDGPVEIARTRHRINHEPAPDLDGVAWSRYVRELIGPSS